MEKIQCDVQAEFKTVGTHVHGSRGFCWDIWGFSFPIATGIRLKKAFLSIVAADVLLEAQ